MGFEPTTRWLRVESTNHYTTVLPMSIFVSITKEIVLQYEIHTGLWNYIFTILRSFIAKWVNSILVNLRYLRFKLLKYKERKKNCNIFYHNFKNIPLCIMRKVSLERYYLVLYDCALTLKMSRMALNSFCNKTLHISLLVGENPFGPVVMKK